LGARMTREKRQEEGLEYREEISWHKGNPRREKAPPQSPQKRKLSKYSKKASLSSGGKPAARPEKGRREEPAAKIVKGEKNDALRWGRVHLQVSMRNGFED